MRIILEQNGSIIKDNLMDKDTRILVESSQRYLEILIPEHWNITWNGKTITLTKKEEESCGG